MQITFLGAAGSVTGSCYLLTCETGEKILVDFGLFQGRHDVEELNYAPVGFDAKELTAVLLTHAHLDHCGRLPLLIAGGYRGPVFLTEATRLIANLSLLDAARLEDENKDEKPPLFSEDDVTRLMNHLQIVEYDKPFPVGSVRVIFRNAGHILGSASIEISEKNEKKIVFSGDLGNSPEDLIQPTEKIQHADVVVMESTYGAGPHPQEDVSKILSEEIQAIEKSDGVLLVPAFSIERTQELLHRIYHLKKNGMVKSQTPVFLDSPMAISVTKIFEEMKNLYSDELASHTDNPFEFSGLSMTQDAAESKQIKNKPGAKVIIAGSGMMSGGRILHHAVNYLSNPSTRVLLVGYQAQGTIGRQIAEGKTQVTIYKKPVEVGAHVREISSMSSHADQPKLLQWLNSISGVQTIFLTHGEEESRTALSLEIKKLHESYHVILPERNAKELV